jgi:hypothetical protein
MPKSDELSARSVARPHCHPCLSQPISEVHGGVLSSSETSVPLSEI